MMFKTGERKKEICCVVVLCGERRLRLLCRERTPCTDGTRESSFIVGDGPQKKGLELELELDERACFSVLDLSSVPFPANRIDVFM